MDTIDNSNLFCTNNNGLQETSQEPCRDFCDKSVCRVDFTWVGRNTCVGGYERGEIRGENMSDEKKKISMQKYSTSFMRKKEFAERTGCEFFSVSPEVEEKLKSFQDEDVLALDVSVSSPAKVIGVSKVDNIVDFLNGRFSHEKVSVADINKSFEGLK